MKVFDLSLSLSCDSPVFPGVPKPEIKSVATKDKEGYNELLLSFTTHTATHIDAPFHFLKDRKKISDFDISHFIGEAIILDCRNQKEIILEEKQLSLIKENDFVFLFTSYVDSYPNERYFKDYPIISSKSAQDLVSKKVRIFGMDSPSPDHEPYRIHEILLKKEIMILENLCNLSSLVNKRFRCIIAPLKLKDGDGAPCRVIVIVD